MELEVRRVQPTDVEELHEILRLCGEDMQARFGLSHWIPPFPLERFRESARVKQVHAVYSNGQTIATFTIGSLAPFYYAGKETIWHSPAANALYINHLAVLPQLQGQGIGSRCLQIIEQIAGNEDYEAIRLDAYALHLKLLDFYRKAGYQPRGRFTVFTPLRGEGEIVCFEKVRQNFAA